MKCNKCGKEINIPRRAYLNLESYHQGGGRVLVSSECCGNGVWLTMKQTFSVEQYTGNDKEDNWGIKIKK